MTTAIYRHTDCLAHEMGSWHPESPARLQAIEDQLIASRIDSFVDHREAPLADLSDIARVHHALSVLLVAQVNRWDDDNELKEILTALEFNEVEINMLRNLALINDNCAENIKMVKKQLARMLELKIVGA